VAFPEAIDGLGKLLKKSTVNGEDVARRVLGYSDDVAENAFKGVNKGVVDLWDVDLEDFAKTSIKYSNKFPGRNLVDDLPEGFQAKGFFNPSDLSNSPKAAKQYWVGDPDGGIRTLMDDGRLSPSRKAGDRLTFNQIIDKFDDDFKKAMNEFDRWQDLEARGLKMDFSNNLKEQYPDLVNEEAMSTYRQTGKKEFDSNSITHLSNTARGGGTDTATTTGQKLKSLFNDHPDAPTSNIKYIQQSRTGDYLEGVCYELNAGTNYNFQVVGEHSIQGTVGGKSVTVEFISPTEV
jgi:hypothetical protein